MKIYTTHSPDFAMIPKLFFIMKSSKNQIFILLLFFIRLCSWLYYIFFNNTKHLSLFILCYMESRNGTCIHTYIFILILIYIICDFYSFIFIHIGRIKIECCCLFSWSFNEINFALRWSYSLMNEICLC